VTEYFNRNGGGFSLAMASGFSARFALAHIGEDAAKVTAQYWSEHPREGNPSSELALVILWADLPPREELMAEQPLPAMPALLPDGPQREGLPPRPRLKRKYERRAKPTAAIVPPNMEAITGRGK
jgi:hypothetical protein